MRYASEKRIAVTPRGQGTGLVGGSVCVRGGIMLNLSKMNRIIDLDEENLTITVEPGSSSWRSPNTWKPRTSLPARPRREERVHRRQHQHERRRHARGEVRRHEGLRQGTHGRASRRQGGQGGRQGREEQLRLQPQGPHRGIRGHSRRRDRGRPPPPAPSQEIREPPRSFPGPPLGLRTVPKIIQSKAIPTAIEFMEREIIVAAETYLGKSFRTTARTRISSSPSTGTHRRRSAGSTRRSRNSASPKGRSTSTFPTPRNDRNRSGPPAAPSSRGPRPARRRSTSAMWSCQGTAWRTSSSTRGSSRTNSG